MPATRLKDDQNTWNFVFSLLFLAVLAEALWWMQYRTGSLPRAVPVFDWVMMAFAAFRITRLVVYDKITRWFRELFVVVSREYESGGKTWIELRPFASGPRGTIYDLLQCPWCVSFWASLVVVFVYFTFSWAWIMILFMATAGAGSLLQLLANLVGWQAENLKLDARQKEKSAHAPIDASSLGK